MDLGDRFMDWNDDFDSFSGTSSAKCPNCGANIFFNEKIGMLVCSMCGGLYEPESLKSTGRIENRDVEDAGEEEDNKNEFVCDSCGATVVTDYNTAATFCAFCGSPTLIKRRLSKSFRPDLIIPFKVSKDEAIANFRAWAKNNKGVPKEFTSDATLTKITGYYVPFWLIDADCNAVVGGSGKLYDGDSIAIFSIDRTVKFRVKRVPFDGCKKIPNTLMEAVEPFEYEDIVEYNDMYLPGFYAQRYDVSAIDMLDIIKIRIDTYASGLVKHFTAGEYDSVSVGSTGSYSENFSQNYALLPVWFLNVKYKGINYGIAVNGQTGKASGDLPVSSRKVFKDSSIEVTKWAGKYLAITGVFSLVFTLLGGVGLTGSKLIYNPGLLFGTIFGMFIVFWIMTSLFGLTIFIPFAKKTFEYKRFHESVTIDKAPDVEHYIDYKSKFDMTKNDTFAYMTVRNVDKDDAVYGKDNILFMILRKVFK